jgi:uncharacterized protein
MSIFLLIILAIPLLSLAWWVWADTRLRRMGAKPAWRIGLGFALAVLLGGFIWVMLSRKEWVSAQVPPTLYGAVLLWGLIFLPFLALPSMLAWALGRIARQIAGRKEPRDEIGTWTRRKWLGAATLSLPVIGTFLATAISLPQMKRFRVREISVTLPELPEALDGLTIAHLTDTHVGKFTKGELLDDIVAATNALNADLVLFTGDLIDNTIRDLPAAIQMLHQLKPGQGLYLIEGNHDLIDDGGKFVRDVLASGLNLLRNQSATIQIRGGAVQLLGIVWKRSEAKIALDVEAIAALREPEAFPILLAHHPHAFDRAAELGIPLTLAGHTHGGQLMLNEDTGAGPAMFRYWSGIYRKNGKALVVGNGTGNWFPLRVNAPAEIIHLTLRRG